MADRFANGDPTNDTGGLAGGPAGDGPRPDPQGLLPRRRHRRAGGPARLHRGDGHDRDLADAELQEPARPGRRRPGVSAGYHGYWVTDFTRIDPHFGTNAELEAFIDARARARHQGLLRHHHQPHRRRHRLRRGRRQRLRRQGGRALPRRRGPGRSTTATTPAARRSRSSTPATSFPYTPVFRTEADATVKVPAWLNDPHPLPQPRRLDLRRRVLDVRRLRRPRRPLHRAARRGRRDDRHLRDVGRLRHRRLPDRHRQARQHGVLAGVRAGHARRGRGAVGNDDFFAFGEVFDSNPAYLSTFTTEGRLRRDARLRLPGQRARASPRAGRPPGCATSTPPTTTTPTPTPTPTRCRPSSATTTWAGSGRSSTAARGDELLERDRLAHALMYLTRGQPVVYYGDEQGFTGDGGDQDARQDMFPSRVATYNDDDLIGTDATTAEANFDTGHPLYRHHRATWPGCATSTPRSPTAPSCTATPATTPASTPFSRIDADEDREYVVALNNADDGQDRHLRHRDAPRRTFQQVVAGEPHVAAQRRRGSRHGHGPAAVGGRLARRRHPGRARRRPGGALRRRRPPAAPSAVAPRSRVAVPDGGFNQVTLAWRPVGRGRVDRRSAPTTTRRTASSTTSPALAEGHAGRVPRRAARQQRQPVGDLDVRHGRRPATEPPPGGGGGTGPVDPAGPRCRCPARTTPRWAAPATGSPTATQAQLSLDAERPGVEAGPSRCRPASYAYKAAIDGAWDENYGAGGVAGRRRHPAGPRRRRGT